MHLGSDPSLCANLDPTGYSLPCRPNAALSRLQGSVTQPELCEHMKGMHLMWSRYRAPTTRANKEEGIQSAVHFQPGHECPQALEDIACIKADERAPHAPWGLDYSQPAEQAPGRFKSAMQCHPHDLWWPGESMEERWEKCQLVWEQSHFPKRITKHGAELPRL